MSHTADDLRVAFIAGTLDRGGAEKQLLFHLRALRRAGARLEVLTLTRGEHHEAGIVRLGIPVRRVGVSGHPAHRLVAIARALRTFRPHVVQAAHFFVNVYAAAGARSCGAVELGCLRSDGLFDVAAHGMQGRLLLHAPRALVANSEAARRAVSRLRLPVGRVHVLPNAVDLPAAATGPIESPGDAPVALAIGRLTPVKRYDRFLDALQAARRLVPSLRGEIVGDGPSRADLESRARALGLLPDAVRFTGARDDVDRLLRRASMLVSCSDHEGVPNVVLEAMAAGVPVIATPAGECPALVRDGATGLLVPFEPVSALAAAMIRLAQDRTLAQRLAHAARAFVRQAHAADAIAPRLLAIYDAEARAQYRPHTSAAVARLRQARVSATPEPAPAAV
ncbi:MAG TPA: glycosyltransferase [Vicinamibacterales bacterium]